MDYTERKESMDSERPFFMDVKKKSGSNSFIQAGAEAIGILSNPKGQSIDSLENSGLPAYQTYSSRCNFSLLSNYILYVVFIVQTGFYFYYAFVYSKDDETDVNCYARVGSSNPQMVGHGRDITQRFN